MFISFFAPDVGRTAVFAVLGRQLSRAAILALAACAHGALASDAPLSLAEAQRLALGRSRGLAAQDAAYAAAQDLAVAAAQLPDPVLKAGVDNLPVNGASRYKLGDDSMTMRRIGVMQEITRPDKRRLRAQRYEREADRASAEKDRLAAGIERDTALAWLERYYTEAMLAAVAVQREQGRLAIDAAEGAYRGGRGTQAELLAARSALAMIDDRASELEQKRRNATLRLERWIGPAAQQPLFGKPAIDVLRFDLAGLDATRLAAHLAQHPDLAVLGRQEQIAQAEADLARANQKSDWTVELNYQHRGSGYSDMVSVGLSVPLQWDRRNRQDRELAARLAGVEQARDEREELLREHVAETSVRINEWRNDRERLQRYEHELIPLAVERSGAALAAYRGARAGIGEVLAARRDEIDLRLQALQLELATAQLWAQLNFLFPSARSLPEPAPLEHK